MNREILIIIAATILEIAEKVIGKIFRRNSSSGDRDDRETPTC